MDTAKVAALLQPRNVVIVGASDREGSWSARIWANLKRFSYPGPVYPVNPRRDTVWGGRCYPSVRELPEPPDHVVVLVPASSVVDVLRESWEAGARSATVFSGGFGEGNDPAGRERAAALSAFIRDSGLAVSGPNCMGNLAAAHRLVTITDDRIGELEPGPVAIVGQSGGIVTALYRSLADRAVPTGYLVTSGNEVGLTTADYIRFFALEDSVHVVACFIESVKDRDAFLEACRLARDRGKPVVALKVGGSRASRAAALAHTGSLAGSLEAFDAVAGDAGVIRLDTLDELIEAVEFLVHAPVPKGRGMGAITFSGGLKTLILEQAERARAHFPELSASTLTALQELLGVGTSLGNPLDVGFTGLSDRGAYLRCVEILLEDPNIDVLLLQEELPRSVGTNRKVENLRAVDEQIRKHPEKPVAILSMLSHSLTDDSRNIRATFPHLPFLQEPYKSLKAVRGICEYGARMEAARARAASSSELPGSSASHVRERVSALLRDVTAEVRDGKRLLNEVDAKTILRAYGIPTPEERVASSPDAAVKVADAIGYPVVLKGVSAKIPHKSDSGLVYVGLIDAEQVRRAFESVEQNVRRRHPGVELEGMLVARQVTGGLELILGIHRDPEMGPVILFGAGGVLLELYQDVALGRPPLDRFQAEAMIAATKVGRLLEGYRGGPKRDREAVISTLLAMSRLAVDWGAIIESVDVNPFVAMPEGQGGYALDALAVLMG